MQMENEYNMDARSTTYMGKMIANQLQKGDNYLKLKKAIVINILNFNFYSRNSYHSVARMKFEKTSKEAYVDMGYGNEEEIATKYMEIHIIELKKFQKKNPDAKTKINQWLWLLAGKKEKQLEIAKKMLKKNILIEEIKDITGLDIEEIERIQKKN